jgi:hypothetical protein
LKGEKNKVFKLKKVLYGLNQVPRLWYSQTDKHFINKKSKSEPTSYIKKKCMDILIVSLYVDDLICTDNSEKMMDDFKKDMMETYEISDLGMLHYFLGIEVLQNDECISYLKRSMQKII